MLDAYEGNQLRSSGESPKGNNVLSLSAALCHRRVFNCDIYVSLLREQHRAEGNEHDQAPVKRTKCSCARRLHPRPRYGRMRRAKEYPAGTGAPESQSPSLERLGEGPAELAKGIQGRESAIRRVSTTRRKKQVPGKLSV